MEKTRPQRAYPHPADKKKRSWRSTCCGCGCLLPGLAVILIIGIYLFAPWQTNILLLGIDSREPGSYLGRTDTIILITADPIKPALGMLSIPRDLWVTIPGREENRINTAHFFAEAEQPGSGPQGAMETVKNNFGVPVRYYVRIGFDGLPSLVNTLGGVRIDLPQAMSGYDAGSHQINGEQALAFVRDRSGSDDFSRMARGQIFVKGLLGAILSPSNWSRLPDAGQTLPNFVDTNVPIWLWPRLGIVFLRVGPGGIDSRVIDRDLVTPFTTSGGAAVLAPNWDRIDPVVEEMFGPRQ